MPYKPKSGSPAPRPRSGPPPSKLRKIDVTPEDLVDIQRFGIRFSPEEVKPDGKGGFLLSARGALKAMFVSREKDLPTAEGRARIRRYKQVARALLSAEQAKVSPRSTGDVLYEAFGGPAVGVALREGDEAMHTLVDLACARLRAELALEDG